LTAVILPRALKTRSVEVLRDFENRYERIGIPALVIQVVTGLWLASQFVPFSLWFQWDSPLSRAVVFKLALLGLTAMLALDARLRIIPRLSPERLGSLAWHIMPVTLISVLFVFGGVVFRVGG